VELRELLARFKMFQVGVLLFLAILMVLNVAALVLVLKKIDRVAERPISVSCSGFHGSLPPVDGVRAADMRVDKELAAKGKIGAVATFRLAEKVPNSQVVLAYRYVERIDDPRWSTHYRPLGTGEWSIVPMSATDDPLTFMASVTLESIGLIEYRLEQRVDGEIVHASDLRHEDVEWMIGGTGSLYARYSVSSSGPPMATLTLYSRYGPPQIPGFRVAEIKFKINKARPIEVVLEGEEDKSEYACSFDPEGLKDIEITVTYKDGEVRTAKFDPSVPLDEGEPLVVR